MMPSVTVRGRRRICVVTQYLAIVAGYNDEFNVRRGCRRHLADRRRYLEASSRFREVCRHPSKGI